MHIDQDRYLLSAQPSISDKLLQILEQDRLYLSRWMEWPSHITGKKDCIQMLKEMHLFNQCGQKFYTFLFEKQVLLGSVALLRIHHKHQGAELGFWLRRQHQGTGLMTQACRAFVDFIFEQTALVRLEIHIIEGNQRAIHIAKHLGFQLEGTLRHKVYHLNRYQDMHIYGLVKP